MNLSRLRKHAESEVSVRYAWVPPNSAVVERVGWLQSMGRLTVAAVHLRQTAPNATQHGAHAVLDVPLALPVPRS